MKHTNVGFRLASLAFALITTIAPVKGGQDMDVQGWQQSRRVQEPSIEGTWLFTLDRIHQGFSFTALQSFTTGGVTLATGSMDRTPPPPISPLYGSWESAASNRYLASVFFYLYDLSGNPVGMIKTDLRLHLTGRETLEGKGEAYTCDLNAENCVRADVVDVGIKGKRLKAERIND